MDGSIHFHKGIKYWLQSDGTIRWDCPKCRIWVKAHGFKALELMDKAGMCQGCRAAETFRRQPNMIGTVLEFWARTDSWPESHSWMEAANGRGGMFVAFSPS
jgi:hypothetical protein